MLHFTYIVKVQRLLSKAVKVQSSMVAQLRNRGVNLSAYSAFQGVHCVQSRILFEQTSFTAMVARKLNWLCSKTEAYKKRSPREALL